MRTPAETARAIVDGNWNTLDELRDLIELALKRTERRVRKACSGVRHVRSRPLPPVRNCFT